MNQRTSVWSALDAEGSRRATLESRTHVLRTDGVSSRIMNVEWLFLAHQGTGIITLTPCRSVDLLLVARVASGDPVFASVTKIR